MEYFDGCSWSERRQHENTTLLSYCLLSRQGFPGDGKRVIVIRNTIVANDLTIHYMSPSTSITERVMDDRKIGRDNFLIIVVFRNLIVLQEINFPGCLPLYFARSATNKQNDTYHIAKAVICGAKCIVIRGYHNRGTLLLFPSSLTPREHKESLCLQARGINVLPHSYAEVIRHSFGQIHKIRRRNE